ncbi:nucleotidyltransferase family protein [Salegentibacter salegens]|uniref:Molybdenum cofactor cytidylyltransferase n=1 Tax=Salegentibacter salegens TaxID=143223 RepID=A0A1M7LMC4_9FLAO|nr:nucleotidyltransferase family protein [Salegentibacter salegens]PRX43032.1 molybdenum cofactor cytidylyltransferase [Salegentibacter salegens]SHM79197.1 molybdenum cofactor cytidylyltransferase [Salegentibacter salegens]
MKENSKIGVVILAAGSSSRLGYPKQLVKFRKKTLLQHSIEVAESFNFAINILVLGANATEIEMKTECRNFQIVYNQEWEKGMGTSIGKGISEALKLENELDYILILLSDQPFVTAQKIEELVQVQLNGDKPATFSEYSGETGVPAIFSQSLFSDLKMLKGDQGAKKLLHTKNLKFETVPFENANFDVDTAADVELLKKMEEKFN